MALELADNMVFLHVPKTGGSYVSDALADAGLVERTVGHIHADVARYEADRAPLTVLRRSMTARVGHRLPAEVRRRLKAAWADRHPPRASSSPTARQQFFFVRHPLDWYRSWWAYMYERAGADWSTEPDLLGWHPCAPLRALGARTFAGFVDNVIDQEPGFVTELFGRYISEQTAFVGRQERLVDDLCTFASTSGLAFSPAEVDGRARVNTSAITADVISDATRSELMRLEYPALRRFGYEDPGC